MFQQVAIPVSDKSQIGEARRAAVAAAEHANLGETPAGRVAIIVTELAANLVRYAKDGMILLRSVTDAVDEPSVEVLSIDSGPGFDSARGLSDGYSTGGTPGNGLGAVQRLASAFDVYSSEPSGTVIMARVAGSNGQGPTANFRWSSLSLPAPGETVCGDTWRVARSNGNVAFMIADGLGHGPEAATAAEHAVDVFTKEPFVEVDTFLARSHQAMMGTRGSALAIANLNRSAATLTYAGVGNIAGTIVAPTSRQGLASHNGIVGVRVPKPKHFEYPIPPTAVLIMHSDGLQTRWSLDNYPGLTSHHPAVIAGVLYRDFYRDRDDVTILVGAWQGGLS